MNSSCGPHTSNQSVFEQLFVAPTSKQTKRRRSHKDITFSEEEYLEVTTNMTEHDSAKQQMVEF